MFEEAGDFQDEYLDHQHQTQIGGTESFSLDL